MNEKDYQYVLTVAKCRSFSHAAEILYISQPSLSRYISTLESKLNIMLFDRSKSPIQVTEAGKIFCVYGEKILNMEKSLYRKLHEQNGCEKLVLKVGAPPISGDYILSRLLPRMANNYPSIQLELCSDYSYNLYRKLASQQIDVACVVAPNTDPSIAAELILYEKVFLVAARTHPSLRNYDTEHANIDHPIMISPQELNDYPMIQFIASYTEACLRQQSYSPKTIIKASSSPLALELAAKGVGLTSVVRCQLKYGRSEIVQSLVPISIGDCKLPVYIVYNRMANKSLPEINLFIEEAKEEYFDASGL